LQDTQEDLRGVGGKTKMRLTGQRGGNGEEINHGAFEEGLDKINRIFRIIGISNRF
jgi:hypothetical protein